MRFADVQRMKESTFKRFVRLPHFDEHLELHRLDCLASHGDLSLYEFTREKRAAMPQSVMRPAPLLSGDDLISTGYKPGPQFKKILAAVEDGQLDGRLQTKNEAMQMVLREFPLSSSTEAPS
jgi:poly(A) polymerase